MEVETVVVVGGGGVMGSGIAQVVAQAGLQVLAVDIDETSTARGLERIDGGLRRLVKRERLTQEQAEAVIARIETSTDLEGSGERADHVIESVIEDLETKTDVLRRLDRVCREEVVFASNTSQFPISGLAAATERPDRVIGSHRFDPPPVLRLIEVIRGVETSDEILSLALELAGRYGDETIVCKKDTPGSLPRG